MPVNAAGTLTVVHGPSGSKATPTSGSLATVGKP
jgi:hypothetical protein